MCTAYPAVMHRSCLFNTHTCPVHYESQRVLSDLLKYALLTSHTQCDPQKSYPLWLLATKTRQCYNKSFTHCVKLKVRLTINLPAAVCVTERVTEKGGGVISEHHSGHLWTLYCQSSIRPARTHHTLWKSWPSCVSDILLLSQNSLVHLKMEATNWWMEEMLMKAPD